MSEKNLQNETPETPEVPETPVENQEPAEQPVQKKYVNGSRKVRDMDEFAKEIESRQNRDTKAKKRNWWIKTLLLLVLIGISIYILFPITNALTEDSTASLGGVLSNIASHYWYLIALVGVVLVFMLCESFQYSYLLKVSTGKFRIRSSVKVAFLGKYYDFVTPLGTGGQPFQIYYLHKKDIPPGVATAVPLVKYIVHTFSKGILSVVMFSLVFVLIPGEVLRRPEFTTIIVVAWVSMVANMLIPLAMLIGSLFPRAGKKLVIKVVALLAKMHIVKRKYAVTKKYVIEMDEYRRALKELLRNWTRFIPLFLLCIFTATVNFSIPYFTLLALTDGAVVVPTGELYAQMLCLGLLSYYSSSLVPSPGNSGATEVTSSLVFTMIDVPEIAWVIFLWRFLTFYLYVFAGVGINIFDIIRGAVRNRRAAKQEALEAADSDDPPLPEGEAPPVATEDEAPPPPEQNE